MKDYGIIKVALKADNKNTKTSGGTPKVVPIQVEVFRRFTYAGHEFMIHHPRTNNPKDKKKFVGSHTGLGCLVSERPSATGNAAISDPMAYETIDMVETIIKMNIDDYKKYYGKSLDEVVRNHPQYVVKPKRYTQLKTKKIIR